VFDDIDLNVMYLSVFLPNFSRLFPSLITCPHSQYFVPTPTHVTAPHTHLCDCSLLLSHPSPPLSLSLCSESEAVRFLESVQDLLFQKEKIDSGSLPRGQSGDAHLKQPKLARKLTKKDISAPCNFKHVSGIP